MELDPIQPDVENLAGTLRHMFAQAKSEQMGRRYSPADRFKDMKLWRAAAERCLEVKADPHDFVKAAVMFCSVAGGPFPQHMGSPRACQWYRSYLKIIGAEEGDDVYEVTLMKMMQTVLIHGMTMAKVRGKRLRDILLDEFALKLDFAPAFIRVLLLPDDPAIRDKWANKARCEITDNPRLIATLVKLKCDLNWLKT